MLKNSDIRTASLICVSVRAEENELIAQVAARRLLHLSSPERRAHDAGEKDLCDLSGRQAICYRMHPRVRAVFLSGSIYCCAMFLSG
jgi:hypothetical protein